MAEAAAQSGKLNVFISYSRDDLDFASTRPSLLFGGFDTTIDRRGILGGKDWKARLGLLIRDADTVVFVLSAARHRGSGPARQARHSSREGPEPA